jgi:hypothetical protein
MPNAVVVRGAFPGGCQAFVGCGFGRGHLRGTSLATTQLWAAEADVEGAAPVSCIFPRM